MSFVGTIIRIILEREGRKHSLAEWPAALAKSEPVVAGRIQAGVDSAKNRAVARHIIGIERWSQSRLRVFLGGELVRDEYDEYQPAEDLDLAALSRAFVETRQATLALTEEIVAAAPSDEQKVPHNDMGDVNVRTWLAYINGHAGRESGRIKQ